ncbi:hypothetical protein CEXT_303331, partial [Caerostris extrusa]
CFLGNLFVNLCTFCSLGNIFIPCLPAPQCRRASSGLFRALHHCGVSFRVFGTQACFDRSLHFGLLKCKDDWKHLLSLSKFMIKKKPAGSLLWGNKLQMDDKAVLAEFSHGS